MSVCTSALAIFMDRFWNQGYLWTPYDQGMTRKIYIFRTKNFPPWMPHLSEPKISLLECLIFLSLKVPSLNASFLWTKNFPPWMPHLSEFKISHLECLICLNQNFSSLNASFAWIYNFPPWIPYSSKPKISIPECLHSRLRPFLIKFQAPETKKNSRVDHYTSRIPEIYCLKS